MKVIILFACILIVTVAEPPVGNEYPSNHQQDHYANDYQGSSPSQEYGAPSSSAFEPPQGFGLSRSLNSAYGTPNLNSLPQEYASSSLQNSVPQEYRPPGLRSRSGIPRNMQPTSEYGVPNERPTVMDSYSAPIHGQVSNPNTRISEDYRLPNQRDFGISSPSQEYGTPFRSNPSQKYGLPNSRTISQAQRSNYIGSSYDTPKGYNKVKNFSPPKSTSSFNSPSLRSTYQNQYLPNSRSSENAFASPIDSFSPPSPNYGVPSSTYGVPSSNYGVPSSNYGPPSSNYGVPLKTTAIASSYQSPQGFSSNYGVPRSSRVSESYGVPAVEARSGVPSEEYGVPDRNGSGQGYDYESVKKALEELQNQEPANYDFQYKVNDDESGSDFGHSESRQDNKAEGSYFVLLPDGTKQTVQYEADERGFKPRISVEAVKAGYDGNAANIQTKSGPY